MTLELQFPTDDQRLAMRERPRSGAIMYQSWIDLLFLHWRMDARSIQALLPDGLFVDCFEGDAFIGVVPFFMKNIRFRGTPAVPWVSNFLELNLRTYVFDRAGNPGVWFFSLDCNQPLAVWAARTLFHLPYQHASMRAVYQNSASIDYRSTRRSQKSIGRTSRFSYEFNSTKSLAQPGTLEFFLVERYLLFSLDRSGTMLSGRVNHAPYPLCEVNVQGCESDLFELNGFTNPSRPFDHAIGSRGVSVEVFPLVNASTRP